MPIDLAAVNWAYVAILSLFAFVAALLGSLISFRNRFGGAVVTAILFAVAFVYWTYYPHPNLPGPIAVGPIAPVAAVSPAPSRGDTPGQPRKHDEPSAVEPGEHHESGAGQSGDPHEFAGLECACTEIMRSAWVMKRKPAIRIAAVDLSAGPVMRIFIASGEVEPS